MAKSKSTPKKKVNTKKVTSIQPKLKQKQKILHRLKALVRIINFSVFAAFVYGFYLIWGLPFWNVKTVELNGLSNVGYKYISKFMPEKSYKGINILTINPTKISKTLNNVRVFRNVNAYRSLFPTSLTINFEERTPYFTIYDVDTEKDITIDEEGIVLTYSKEFDKTTRFFPKPKNENQKSLKKNQEKILKDKDENKPVLEEDKGKAIYSIKKVKNFRLASDQLNVIRVIENLRENKKIEDLGIFDITNSQNIILNTEENQVLLGNLEEFVMKIKSIPGLETLSKNNKNELEYIDVRYWRNPVLKLKKGSDSYEETKKEFHN